MQPNRGLGCSPTRERGDIPPVVNTKKTPRDGPVAFLVGVAGVVPADLDQSDFSTPVTRSPSPLSWIDTFSPFWIEGTATSRGMV